MPVLNMVHEQAESVDFSSIGAHTTIASTANSDGELFSIELALALHAAATALESVGLTVQDMLDDLPAARAEVLAEIYGADYLRKLEEERLDVQGHPQGE